MGSDADPQIVLGVGELLWDCFPGRRLPGGAPANVVYHAARLGCRGVLASRVGDDADGRELRAFLEGKGIDLTCLQTDPARPTGRVTVDVSDPSGPRFEIHEDAAWDAIALDEALAAVASSCDAVCVGTLAQRSARSRETIRRVLDLASGALRVYDVNLRPPFVRREWIEQTLARATVVKLNDDEVTALDDRLGIGAGDPVRFARALIGRFGAELVCVTRGAEGALLVTADDAHDEPGIAIRVVDAVGAGDAFTAGLIAARLRGLDLARSARMANRLGAAVAGRSGAMPELAETFAPEPGDHG